MFLRAFVAVIAVAFLPACEAEPGSLDSRAQRGLHSCGDDGGWRVGIGMGTPRGRPAAARLGSDRVIVVGGGIGSEIYELRRTSWSPGPALQNERVTAEAVALPDGSVLVADSRRASGEVVPSELMPENTVEWSAAGAMAVGPAGPLALLNDGTVLSVGAAEGEPALARAERFLPALRQWQATAPMTSARTAHFAVALGTGELLVGGGVDGSGTTLASTEIFDPVSGTFAPGPPLIAARRGSAVAQLNDGRVVVFGGYDSGGTALATTEVLGQSGSWEPGPAMSEPRAGSRAIGIPRGGVLLAGGVGADGAPLSTTNIYRLDIDRIEAFGSLGDPRPGADFVALGNGQVYAIGGGETDALATTELFCPPPPPSL